MSVFFFNDTSRLAHEGIVTGADGQCFRSAVEANDGAHFGVFLGYPLDFRGTLCCSYVYTDSAQRRNTWVLISRRVTTTMELLFSRI